MLCEGDKPEDQEELSAEAVEVWNVEDDWGKRASSSVSISLADSKRNVDELFPGYGGKKSTVGDSVEVGLWKREIMLSTRCLIDGRRIEK